jgi:hypothetical protein
MAQKKLKPKASPRLQVTSGETRTRKKEDPWDVYLKEQLEKAHAPWTVAPLNRQFIVRNKIGTVIAACDSEENAEAIAGIPYAHCSMLGANRVIETATDFEIETLKTARKALGRILWFHYDNETNSD